MNIEIMSQKSISSENATEACMGDICIWVRAPSNKYIGARKDCTVAADQAIEEYMQETHIKNSGKNTSEPIYGEDEENFKEEYGYDDIEEPQENAVDAIEEECADFTDIVSFAKNFVKNIVDESEAAKERFSLVSEVSQAKYGKNPSVEDYRYSFDFVYVEPKKSAVLWPTIGNFTVDQGACTIDQYLSNFDTEEDWMYVIYYQGKQETKCSDFHKYQAIYSLPTWRYPVAQATASIFFIIEVNRAKPPHCPVNVTFNYETFRRIHRPGISDFQERWLHYILDAKIKFFQTITY